MGQFLCGLFGHKVRVNDKQYVVVKDVGEGGELKDFKNEQNMRCHNNTTFIYEFWLQKSRPYSYIFE